MKEQPAYLKGTNKYSFRPGESAEIIGVFMVEPNPELPFRACFKVKYKDGIEDFVPVSDVENYIVTK